MSGLHASANALEICGLSTTGSVLCIDTAGATSIRVASGAQDVSVGYGYGCYINAANDVRCWVEISNQAGSHASSHNGTYTSLACGILSTCAIASNGAVTCWGGFPAPTSPPSGTFTAVQATGATGCGLRSSGLAECWGTQFHQTPPNVPLDMLTGGGNVNSPSFCGISTSSGDVVCWGGGVSAGAL